MSRSNRDVGGYRGRRTATDILKFIAIVLGVLVALAIAGVIYLQRYMVYTDEGARLELPPFLQILRQNEKEPPGSSSLPDPGSLSIDVQPPVDQSQPDPKPDAPSFALQLTVNEVLDGSAAAKLEEAAADMLILEVKDQEGQLAWLSALEEAAKSKVNNTQQTTDALRQWNAGEIYTVARVCCFRDNSAGYHINSQALHQSNGTWRDELGLRWLSPARDQSQAYIAGLCGELAQLGFDEIVLEHFSFPVHGKLERILKGDAYNSAQFTAEMDAFLSQVRQAVEPYGTKLSLRVERGTLTGEENVSGLTAQLLEQYAHRLWVEDDSLTPAPLDLLERAGITNGADRLVEIRSIRAENSSLPQALLPPAQ